MIAKGAFQRLAKGGRLVANVNSVDNLAAVRQVLQRAAGDLEIRMVNIAHSTHQFSEVRFESRNPTFLISVRKANP